MRLDLKLIFVLQHLRSPNEQKNTVTGRAVLQQVIMSTSFAGVDLNHILSAFSSQISGFLRPTNSFLPSTYCQWCQSRCCSWSISSSSFRSPSVWGWGGQRRQKRRTTSEMMFTKFTSVNEITSWWHQSVRTSTGPPARINQLYLHQTSALWTRWELHNETLVWFLHRQQGFLFDSTATLSCQLLYRSFLLALEGLLAL